MKYCPPGTLEAAQGQAQIQEAYARIIVGQAHQAGVYQDKEALEPSEVTVVRLAQLTRVVQNRAKGWGIEDVKAALDALSPEHRELLVDSLGRQGERSFTITYLPGIAGRITELADATDEGERRAVLSAVFTFYAHLFEALKALPPSIQGEHRVYGSWIRFTPELAPEGRDPAETLALRINAFNNFWVEALPPTMPGATIELKQIQN